MITLEKLKETLEYNPDTGIFTWKIPKKGTKGVGSEAGTLTKNGYKDVCIEYKKYGLHRLAFLYMSGQIPKQVDHINSNESDNRWCNLRPVTIRQNAFNSIGTGCKSKFKNVYYDPRGLKKWFVRITKEDGTKLSLGYYSSPEEANIIATAVRKEIHKEYFHNGNQNSRE